MLGVDERTRHPGLEGSQRHNLERGIGDAHRRRREPSLTGRLEAEPCIVVRRSLKEDRRCADAFRLPQGVPDQPTADPLTLILRDDTKRAENQYLSESRGGVHPRPRQLHMTNGQATDVGDERQPVSPRRCVLQRFDKIRDDASPE